MPLVLVEVAVVAFRRLLEEALLDYSMDVDRLDFESFTVLGTGLTTESNGGLCLDTFKVTVSLLSIKQASPVGNTH